MRPPGHVALVERRTRQAAEDTAEVLKSIKVPSFLQEGPPQAVGRGTVVPFTVLVPEKYLRRAQRLLERLEAAEAPCTPEGAHHVRVHDFRINLFCLLAALCGIAFLALAGSTGRRVYGALAAVSIFGMMLVSEFLTRPRH